MKAKAKECEMWKGKFCSETAFIKSFGRTRSYTKATKDDEKKREKAETNQREMQDSFC